MTKSPLFQCDPVAAPDVIFTSGRLRISVLTSRLVRLEWGDRFEDRASQHFWNRQQPCPQFQIEESEGIMRLETEHLRLEMPAGFPPTKQTLRVAAKGEVAEPAPSPDADNLGGCLRTLDTVRGRWNYKTNREEQVTRGLFSKSGWVLLDDSESLVFDEAGQLQSRPDGTNLDLYVLVSGKNFPAALRDYYAVAGRVPLLPKWVLGLWWSRWEAYRQQDFERLADEFESHGVPLSVCVIDMDWHLPGWTGFTWNREFFPDPEGFLGRMHDRGIRACMNLHPHDGVGPHEAAYEAMAGRMGIDPASQAPVPFDLADPKFIEGYFQELLHPLEKQGVDFWWMDWQQGTESTVPGLDPLWLLNHLHSLDLARDGTKRPLAFSRWGGWGAHRYPIGFSGDSSRTWETLEFEVELTAQSANTGFGWWSHDIGGFCDGFPDDELYVRWVQFGVLSPVFRFHNCGDPTLDYRPWSKEEKYREPALEALRWRRALLPYLYTAAYRNSLGEPPVCTPVYYQYPDHEEAYHCPGQYFFGNDLLAAPIATAACAETRLASKGVWLPPGDWFDFHTGTHFPGDGWTTLHADLGEIPVFVRGGAAIPLAGSDSREWVVFPGSGESQCYDDDGTSNAWQSGDYELEHCVCQQTAPQVLEISFSTNAAALRPRRLRLRGFGAAQPSAEGVLFSKDGADWVSEPTTMASIRCEFAYAPVWQPRWS